MVNVKKCNFNQGHLMTPTGITKKLNSRLNFLVIITRFSKLENSPQNTSVIWILDKSPRASTVITGEILIEGSYKPIIPSPSVSI